MNAVVDCHMVGQPAAGDAGNARFHTLLCHALAAGAAPGDRVSALVAHDAALGLLPRGIGVARVSAANVRRLLVDAPRALRRAGDAAGVFSYVVPPLAGAPTVVVVHDIVYRLHPEWFDRRTRTLLNALVPLSIRRAAAVVTVSETSKTDIVAAYGIDDRRIHIVPNVPAPAFAPRPGAATRVRERFGLDRYCLYVGDVHPRKNLVTLAEAVRRLRDPGLTLAVVGRAGHRGDEILRACGGRALGPMGDDDLADLYGAAAVTAYPSLYEGFGLPVVEAMACGSPVVASNRGAIPEVAGQAAILVEPTADGLAEGLAAALEPATAERLRAAGPARAATFTLDDMGTAAWDVLRGVR